MAKHIPCSTIKHFTFGQGWLRRSHLSVLLHGEEKTLSPNLMSFYLLNSEHLPPCFLEALLVTRTCLFSWNKIRKKQRLARFNFSKSLCDFVSRLCVFALLCMGVCEVRGLEREDVRSGVCCMCFTLMPYVVIMKRKTKNKKNIQFFIRFPSCRKQRIRKRDCLMNNSEVFLFVCVVIRL